MPAFSVLDLGLIDYQECLLLQKDLSGRVFEGKSQSSLILCRHNPVITLGRRAKRENILSPEKLASLGIGVIDTNRGGDVTLHLPGQLVIYPVFDLRVFGRDIGCFLRALEEAVILLLADYGIAAKRESGLGAKESIGRTENRQKVIIKGDFLAGVWVRERKIASIGIAVSRWITTHGLSLNVTGGLDLFSLIRPCGRDIMMTSIEKEVQVKTAVLMDEIKNRAVEKFGLFFRRGG